MLGDGVAVARDVPLGEGTAVGRGVAVAGPVAVGVGPGVAAEDVGPVVDVEPVVGDSEAGCDPNVAGAVAEAPGIGDSEPAGIPAQATTTATRTATEATTPGRLSPDMPVGRASAGTVPIRRRPGQRPEAAE